MSTYRYAVCADCKAILGFGEWDDWCPGVDTSDEEIGLEPNNLRDGILSTQDQWIEQAIRLHYFIRAHKGHKVGVYDEHEIDDTAEDEGC